ncbi:glycosyltransferase family 2 protein [Vibrio sp. 10N.261.51.A4]|uniref:glycosyltransferase family 2 protein n=1 Tax=Vibrio sp. 10N.261.51.A4 TaxID=3229674 RepID=UPI00354E9DC5
MNFNKTVNIIVLNFNNSGDTVECLESILESNQNNFRIIVVDNASTDNSYEVLLNWFELHTTKKTLGESSFDTFSDGDTPPNEGFLKRLVLIKSLNNNGYGAGNNIAIRILKGSVDSEYIWILNNDTAILPDTMEQLLISMNDLEKVNNVGFIGSHILYYDEKELSQSAGYLNKILWKRKGLVEGHELSKQGTYEVDDLSGCSLFFSMNMVESIGLIPEEYFLYFEETDWIYNAKLQGFKHFVNSHSKLYHKEARSTGGVSSPFVLYYMTRNKLNFIRKNFHSYFLPYSIFFSFKILLKAGFFSFQNTKMSQAVFKGLFHGLINVKGK